jgi:hypothetical protein
VHIRKRRFVRLPASDITHTNTVACRALNEKESYVLIFACKVSFWFHHFGASCQPQLRDASFHNHNPH